MATTPDHNDSTDLYATPLRGLTSASDAHMRQHERQAVDHDLYLAAANGAGPLVARGTLMDISKGGFRADLDAPAGVGDVYQAVLVESDEVQVDPRFARCLRCAVGDEGHYEASFQFLAPIELPRIGG